MDIQDIALDLALGLSGALLIRLLPERAPWARLAAVAALLAVTARYVGWRSGNLPGLDWTLGSLWPLTFFGFEILAIVYESWTHLVMVWIGDRTAEADRYEERLRREPRPPSVDVFIATFNEGREILLQTIRAAMGLDYPDKRVWVLDDGGRCWLRDLCEQIGAGYIARPRRPLDHRLWGAANYAGRDGKAGNLRYAFERTRGDYILLLDADFAVGPGFLYRTLGFLLYGAGIGCVQVPQRFRNPDPIAHNLLGQDAWPEEQHIFMSIYESCRDAWGNAFCVGTCAVVRRALVERVGGFPHHTITEDFELSYVLLGEGYRTVVLGEPLAYGLAPESVGEYLKQRVRWCVGTIQHLFIKTGPIRGRHRLLDRAFYLEGTIYWCTFIFLALLLAAPAIFWWTGVPAIGGESDEAIRALMPRLIVRSIVTYFLTLGKTCPLVITVMKALASFHISIALILAFIRPFGKPFRVTLKGQRRGGVVVQWKLIGVFAALLGLILIPMAMNLAQVSRAVPIGRMTPFNVGWTLYSCLILALCALVCIELPRDEHELVRIQEVTKTDLLATSLALAKRLILVDALGSVLWEDLQRAGRSAVRWFVRDESGVGPGFATSVSMRAVSRPIRGFFLRPAPAGRHAEMR